MSEEQAVRDKLRRFVIEHARRSVEDLTDDTLILEEGIVSSLEIVELVLYIENLLGTEIDADEIDPRMFASIDTLYQAFFRAT